MSDDPSTANAGVRIFPPVVFLGGLAIGYAIQWLWPVAIFPQGGWSIAVRLIGIAAIASGFWMAVSALSLFRRLGTPPEPWEPAKALAVEGPYRYTRNPMYLGMSLAVAGFALIGNALWPLLALIPAVWIIRTQVIDREERYLESRFGAEYRAFKARVRRWL
jgi:protein-S-isoprenylcysteine O-methyltransferase Ste14